jgi:hypothetical protein
MYSFQQQLPSLTGREKSPSDFRNIRKQAGAELCQAQFKLGLAKIAFPDYDIVFVCVFPVYIFFNLSSVFK